MLTLISCPECDVPAEVTDRFALASTDGPVDHVALRCAAGHHFRMAADRLPAKSQQQLRAHEPVLSPDYASPLAAADVPVRWLTPGIRGRHDIIPRCRAAG